MEFSKIGLDPDVTVEALDIRAIATLIQGRSLCDEQQEVLESLELQSLSRSEVTLADLLKPVALIEEQAKPAHRHRVPHEPATTLCTRIIHTYIELLIDASGC